MKNNRYTYKLLNLDVPMEGYFNKIFSTELVKQLIASSTIQEKLNTKSFFYVFLTYEQIYSYGHEPDLLEIMRCLISDEYSEDQVVGHLAAAEVFKRFKYCY